MSGWRRQPGASPQAQAGELVLRGGVLEVPACRKVCLGRERPLPRGCCLGQASGSASFLLTVPSAPSVLLVQLALEWRVGFKKLPFSRL